jgi:methylated-DNA-[protein]-cysteine S-methyltransferase
MANNANPVGVVVPCHRVVGASGDLTGYGGGLERKRWLLAHETRYAREPTWNDSSTAPRLDAHLHPYDGRSYGNGAMLIRSK